MTPALRAAWLGYTESLEGGIPFPYNDLIGKTTIAYGNLINSVGAALALPFVNPDGSRSSPAEIAAAWQAIHNDPAAAAGGAPYASRRTRIRLPLEAMKDLALRRLDINDADLTLQIPDFQSLPACVQMAMHSWAWAVGTRSPFPRLFSAVIAGDYEAAAVHIHINEWTKDAAGNPIKNTGLVPRNVRNKILMRNGARVRDFKLDPELLDWTHDLDVSDVPTIQSIDNPASSPTIYPESPTVHVDPSLYFDDPEKKKG